MSFSQYNKNHLISQLKAALAAVEAMPTTNDCHTCANLDTSMAQPYCRAAGITIPAEVLEKGCEAYLYDHTIPPF